jgi:hypothetical protein
MNLTMTDYGFYTAEELQDLDDSDLSFEIADTALLKTPEADEYLNLLITELQLRNSND